MSDCLKSVKLSENDQRAVDNILEDLRGHSSKEVNNILDEVRIIKLGE